MAKTFLIRIAKKVLSIVAVTSISVLCLSTLLNFSVNPLNPGVVFQVETTYHSGSAPRFETAEMSVEGEMLKMEILPGSEADAGVVKDEVIFRGDRREMVVVDHESKSYTVMDEDAFEELAKQLEKTRQHVMDMKIPKDVLDKMPEESRKKIEAMMKQQQMAADQGAKQNQPGSSRNTYHKTNSHANKEGYPCVKFDVLRDEEKVRELWVTDWNNVPGGDEAEEAFKELEAFFKDLMDKFDKLMGGGNVFGDGNDPFSGFTEVDGFPIVTKDFEDGDLQSESVLKSARRQRLDPDAFEPPSGYKRMSMGPR